MGVDGRLLNEGLHRRGRGTRCHELPRALTSALEKLVQNGQSSRYSPLKRSRVAKSVAEREHRL